MADFSLNQYGRMSDALERDLMQRALGNGEAISVVALFKSVRTGILNAATAAAGYIKAVTKALNEARARDAEFCGSQW